jgi:hypothetical protein
MSAEQMAAADRRDYYIMLWIAKQAGYAARQDRRYGKGERIKRVHPLARIGMSI